jgi:hypothetical protein
LYEANNLNHCKVTLRIGIVSYKRGLFFRRTYPTQLHNHLHQNIFLPYRQIIYDALFFLLQFFICVACFDVQSQLGPNLK